MKKENVLVSFENKVNKVLAIIFASSIIVFVILCYLKIYPNFISVFVFIIGVPLSMILIYKGYSSKVVKSVLLVILFFQVAYTMVTFPIVAPLMTVVIVCFSAMYLERWLILINYVGGMLVFIYIQLFKYSLDTKSLMMSVFAGSFSALALFCVTSWGRNLILSANEKEMQANNLLLELEKTMKAIGINTITLNKDIVDCNTNLQSVQEASSGITNTVQEITKGVIGQAESTSQINEMMHDAEVKISEVLNYSKQLTDVSNTAIIVVTEGSENIIQMDKQMDIISESVMESLTTVQELEKNMDEVNKFLSGITQIAEQTNLLALNAAIEAARAGETGKGFAVVADEVRKLAEQTSNTVKQIDKIMNVIKAKTQNVVTTAQNGSIATKKGEVIVNQVNEGFKRIQLSFNEIDNNISNELKMIKKTSDLFSKIQIETESIASISEEQSASTEEMLATMEEQNASIEIISSSMQKIEKASENLQEVIQGGSQL